MSAVPADRTPGRSPDRSAERNATPRAGSAGVVLRGALRRARTELRIQLLSPLVFTWLFFPLVGLVVLFFLRGQQVRDSTVSLAQIGVPGLLTVGLVSSGVIGVAGQLMGERDDGTLLRAKAVPHGMAGHLVGNLLVAVAMAVVPTVGVLAVAATFVDDVTPRTAAAWLTFVWVAVLGLFAMLPFGAVLGAWFRDAAMLGWSSIIVYAAMAVSGVFYPISALPGWLQVIGQALPTYWFGLGLRSALLPPEAAALELGGSWRPGLTLVALTVWAVLGLVLAPPALRRMARHQSGSRVAEARDKVLTRGY